MTSRITAVAVFLLFFLAVPHRALTQTLEDFGHGRMTVGGTPAPRNVTVDTHPTIFDLLVCATRAMNVVSGKDTMRDRSYTFAKSPDQLRLFGARGTAYGQRKSSACTFSPTQGSRAAHAVPCQHCGKNRRTGCTLSLVAGSGKATSLSVLTTAPDSRDNAESHVTETHAKPSFR